MQIRSGRKNFCWAMPGGLSGIILFWPGSCQSEIHFRWNNWALCWWYLIRDNQVGKRPPSHDNTLLLQLLSLLWSSPATAIVDTRKPLRYLGYSSPLCIDAFKLTAQYCVDRLLVLQPAPPCREIACGKRVTWDSLRRLCFGELVGPVWRESRGLGPLRLDETGYHPAVLVLPLSADSHHCWGPNEDTSQ